MCGIIGYAGRRPAEQILLSGLRRLEYRGYDSAGISLLSEGEIQSVRAVGNLDRLEAAIEAAHESANGALGPPATIGIGHTRWATHGRVSEQNAHPHRDSDGRVHVVVNGIIENYMALRERLVADGAVFSSETDAEVIAHLIATTYADDLESTVARALGELDGYFAFVAMTLDEPEVLVAARRECPLVIGRGDGESFVASAVPAFLAHTRSAQLVENGEVVVVRAGGVEIRDASGAAVAREITEVTWDEQTAEKGGYETFMLKEIHEQADALAETINDRTVRGDGVDLADPVCFDESLLDGVQRVVFVACGTAYHAGLMGRYAIEEWAGLPVEVDIASEYRYRNPLVGPGDLVIGISQSGETADTLGAMRVARERGARVVALTNVMGSQATRECDGVLYTRAGLEVGVAATKTFLAQLAVVYLLALRLAELRGALAPAAAQRARRCHASPAATRRGAAGRPRQARRRDRELVLESRLRPLHRPQCRPADRARGGAQAEGDLLRLDRRLRRRRDEARSDRDARREHAGRRRRDELAGPRQGRSTTSTRSAPAARR